MPRRAFKTCHLPVHCVGLQEVSSIQEKAIHWLERVGPGHLQVSEAGEDSTGPHIQPMQNFPSSSCLFKPQRNGKNLYTPSLN